MESIFARWFWNLRPFLGPKPLLLRAVCRLVCARAPFTMDPQKRRYLWYICVYVYSAACFFNSVRPSTSVVSPHTRARRRWCIVQYLQRCLSSWGVQYTYTRTYVHAHWVCHIPLTHSTLLTLMSVVTDKEGESEEGGGVLGWPHTVVVLWGVWVRIWWGLMLCFPNCHCLISRNNYKHMMEVWHAYSMEIDMC